MTEVEEQNAIFEEIVALPITNARVQGYIRKGIDAEFKQRKKQYRKWAKCGRADKIPDEKIREAEIAWQESGWVAAQESMSRFSVKMEGVISDFQKNIQKQIEDTILGKWMVNKIPLGHTTPEQLRAAAADEYGRAEGHTNNGDFYLKLADLGSAKIPIMMSLTPERAEQIRAEIFDDLDIAA